MKAVVVFESMFGNTHEVALRIAEGLRDEAPDVRVLPVHQAHPEEIEGIDLLVIGGPTHVHSIARQSTRASAVQQAEAKHLPLEPDTDGPGLKEWLDALPALGGTVAAAFDTRQSGPKLITGNAGHAIAKRLTAHGIPLIAPPESFLVDKVPQLCPGEADRAGRWGSQLAKQVAANPATRG